MIKKPLQAQQSAESEGEEGNLNNFDTNGNDITYHIFFTSPRPLDTPLLIKDTAGELGVKPLIHSKTTGAMI